MSNKDIEQLFNMDYDYDYQNDSLFLYITDDYNYKQSLRLDEDIILDFDQNMVPVAMEVLHTSKRFDVDKIHLRNPIGLDMNIEIGEDYIHIKAAFTITIRNKATPLKFNAEGENSINLPSQETHFAAAVV
jgi:uncharacterized protein YuzE